ncbi:chloramphenicol acetyltransferase [Halosquirtibacter xylanolyticus]|uniref:chloramphenicol acetyltransferase n=1 Tax=Halosquirtibacter xylanolyticus TaxID=3374599 RepID=UPI00374A32E8|nr:chloramphenicol acetyltransferase [Prolixibacteraceae bacterium]
MIDKKRRSKIDISTWKRKEHFEFFQKMQEPYHSVCVEVDATHAFDWSRDNNRSFFLTYMYAFGCALQEVENFRYRIENGEVYCYDFIELGTTIGRDDETFGFGLLSYDPDYNQFVENATIAIDRVRSRKGICLDANQSLLNVVYCSTIPWLRFTSISHARDYSYNDSIPKITFGKCELDGEHRKMPVSIFVDHSLVDGIHIAKMIERFQYYLDCF